MHGALAGVTVVPRSHADSNAHFYRRSINLQLTFLPRVHDLVGVDRRSAEMNFKLQPSKKAAVNTVFGADSDEDEPQEPERTSAGEFLAGRDVYTARPSLAAYG
jgi:hypothetical protein